MVKETYYEKSHDTFYEQEIGISGENPPGKRGKRKVSTVLLTIIGSIFGIILIALLIALIKSPGKLPQLRDEHGNVIPGSISEKTWVEIGGIKQGMFIRGEDPQNPVILYVHGGPGTPMLQFIDYLGKTEKTDRLEKYFTVCYWDQRGSGMTYTKATDVSTMTVEQMVEDTREVSEYLISRFGQEKIYLMGHSWGSYLSVRTLEKYPELYHAYVGVGQSSNFVESERMSYDYMLNHAKEIGDNEAVQKLESFDPFTESFPLIPEEGHQLDYLLVRTNLLNKYGVGHLHDTEVIKGLPFNLAFAKALLAFEGYTLREKINWFLGADFSMIYLFPLLKQADLFLRPAEFDLPFYIIQGDYDYMTSQTLAKVYLDSVQAPVKELITFENSAHSPNLEEPARFVEVFQKIAADVHAQENINRKLVG